MSDTPPPPPPGPFDLPPSPPLGPAALPTGAAFAHRVQTAEERDAEKKANRVALRKLAAAPEMLTLVGLFFLILGAAIEFDGFGLLFAMAIFFVFGWIFMTNGDSLIATLILGAIGLTTAGFVSTRLSADDDSLTWILPALVVVFGEGVVSYNHFRRRRGEISVKVGQTMAQNLIVVTVLSVAVGWVLRSLSSIDGQVQWPWFATTLLILTAGWIAGLVILRRRATPPDRRRYNPGRRMLPPPR